jgi:hypothetical protein
MMTTTSTTMIIVVEEMKAVPEDTYRYGYVPCTVPGTSTRRTWF